MLKHVVSVTYSCALISVLGNLALGQTTADPNAIELRPYVTVLDSASPDRRTTPIYNIGDLDGNAFDDLVTPILVTDDTGRTTSKMLIEQLGAAGVLRADTLEGFNPTLIADWDGDGRKDIFQIETPGGYYRYWLNRGIASEPYFAPARELTFPQDARPTLVQDIDGDGIPDLISESSQKLYVYYGPLLTADTLIPNDSVTVLFDARWTYVVGLFVGNFTRRDAKQLLLLTSSQDESGAWKWSITARLYPEIDRASELWSSTPSVLYTDTVSKPVFVYTAPTVAADFTGDGLDDLLIGDSAHVYVFAGGPAFGSRLMHNSDASLVLTSPHMIAPSRYREMSYPDDIQFLGDITGSGIPYIAVTAATNQDTVGNTTTFFYAGGSATDPYYDATLTWPTWYDARLVGVRYGGAPALAFTNQVTDGVEVDLLRDGLPNLPHTQRSSVERLVEQNEGLRLTQSGSNLTLTLPAESHRLRVYNTIGGLMDDRTVIGDRYTLRIESWPHGAYSIVIDADHSYSAKFIW